MNLEERSLNQFEGHAVIMKIQYMQSCTQTGKTSICNYLGDIIENATGDNRPTKGVRCVEFIADGSPAKDRNSRKVQVELWDLSGDPEYEKFWPAVRHDVNGIIFVYNRDGSHQHQILSKMYNFFVERCNFPNENCLVFFNATSDSKNPEESPLEGVKMTVIDLAAKDSQLRKAFNGFLRTITK